MVYHPSEPSSRQVSDWRKANLTQAQNQNIAVFEAIIARDGPGKKGLKGQLVTDTEDAAVAAKGMAYCETEMFSFVRVSCVVFPL